VFLHFIYLIWTIIIKYEAITLTTLAKVLKLVKRIHKQCIRFYNLQLKRKHFELFYTFFSAVSF